MSVRSWRALLIAFCTFCFIVNAISLVSDGVEASSALGFQVARTTDNAFVRVNSVDAGGAAAASGLRAGDLINIRALSPQDRYRLITGVYPHEQIAVTVVRDGRTLHVIYRAGWKPAWRWDVALYCATSLWLLGFAMLIGWRRADSAEAYSVAGALDVLALKSDGERNSILDALRELPQRVVEALGSEKQLAQ